MIFELPVGGVHVFDEELSLLKENFSMDPAQMLVVSIEVIGLSTAETIKTAAIDQRNRHLTASQGYHMSDSQLDGFNLPVYLFNFHDKAAYFYQ